MGNKYKKGDRVKYRLPEAKRTGTGTVWKVQNETFGFSVYIECDDRLTRVIQGEDVRLLKEGEK